MRIRTPRRTLADRLHGKSAAVTKAALSCAAVLMGVGVILFTVYSAIPDPLGGAARMLDLEFAAELYEKTLETPAIDHTVFEQPPQSAPAAQFPRDAFASVLRGNPDIVGRISAPGIKYLVTQYTDNEYYLARGYDRRESRSGTVFLDYRCNAHAQPLFRHYILYAHHMKDGSMFAPLTAYKDAAFFDANRVIRFDTLYADYEWEIFSAYVTGTDFYYIDTAFASDDDWLAFLRTLRDKSAFAADTPLAKNDVVLTLSTCSYEFDDARFVVHAKLVR